MTADERTVTVPLSVARTVLDLANLTDDVDGEEWERRAAFRDAVRKAEDLR